MNEGGTAEDWEDWAEGIVSEWEKDAEWWELLRKAETGDVFDAADYTADTYPDRWIGMFITGRDGKVYFRYRIIDADIFGREPFWHYYSADRLTEVTPFHGLEEFYGGGNRTDIILVRQGDNGDYAALAATGIYYMPHLGPQYDKTPRINSKIEPDIWGDWALGCLAVGLGAAKLVTLPIGVMKGAPKIHRYLYEKLSRDRLSVYGY